MRITGNEPAFNEIHQPANREEEKWQGLTIRQQFAAMFLQGLLSNSKSAELLALGYSDGTGRERTINMATIASRAAVQYADSLIAELNTPINETDPITQSTEREANNG